MIAIVDYGMGNLRSLINAFDYLGHDAEITADPRVIGHADRVVLPGVGAFGDAMDAMRQTGLRPVLDRQVRDLGKPVLGICLGMQLFAKSSTEHGMHEGLGWVDADVRRLEVDRPRKIPHVGWNDVRFPAGDWLFEGIRPAEANFYFVHSYHMLCHDPSALVATTDYGGPVTAVIRTGNLVAMQFHPEKSQDNGLTLLDNWVRWTPEC